MSDYTVKKLEEAPDVLGDYPGEMRMMAQPLDSEQVAFTWRRMPPDTGGRGSYGHRHKTQEEVYFVAEGKLTFKCGDDEFEAGPGTAVRIAPSTVRSVHNDSDEDAILIIASVTIDDVMADVEQEADFWP